MARSESSAEAHAPVGGTITVVVQSKIESLRVLGHTGGSDSGGSEFGGCCARTSLESQPLLLPHFYLCGIRGWVNLHVEADYLVPACLDAGAAGQARRGTHSAQGSRGHRGWVHIPPPR